VKPSRYNLFIPQGDGEYVVYNTFSGALIILDQEARDSIHEGRIEDIDSDNLQKLTDCNIVVEDSVDERKIFSYLYHKRVHSTETAMFTIVTTYACNLKCPYCYEGAGTLVDNAMDTGTLARILWFIRHVSEISNFKKLEIGLFGGEPLLNSTVCLRALDEIGKWTEENHVKLTSWMFTNGTLLSDSILSVLSHYRTGVRLTLDGPKWYHDRTRIFKDGKGTYDIIMDAISKLVSLGIDISIRIQVVKDNWMHFGELFDDLKKRGFLDVRRIKIALSSIMPLTGICSSYSPLCLQDDEIPEAYAKILEMASEREICLTEKPIPTTQRMFCGFMNDHVFAIDPFGDVYKCISFLGQKQHRIFSIDEKGIGKPTFEFYDFMSRDPSKIPKCRDCVYLPVCSGGCSLLARKKFGTYHTGDCSLHKNTIEKQIFDLVRARVQHSKN
jgi:uncharacterized protein